MGMAPVVCPAKTRFSTIKRDTSTPRAPEDPEEMQEMAAPEGASPPPSQTSQISTRTAFSNSSPRAASLESREKEEREDGLWLSPPNGPDGNFPRGMDMATLMSLRMVVQVVPVALVNRGPRGRSSYASPLQVPICPLS